jgi:uncharacterized phiE125 gp8 family phage protein
VALKLITAAGSNPLTLAEVKAHLRVDHSDDDTLITAMLQGATAHAERFLGRALIDQTWDLYLDEFPDDDEAIEVPLPPLIAVTGVFYRATDGSEIEIDAGDYEVDTASEPGRIIVDTSWPTPGDVANPVRVRFRAGYLDQSSPPAAAVPFDILAALKLIIGSLYEHRESVVVGSSAVSLPWGAEQLLRQHRVHTAMA